MRRFRLVVLLTLLTIVMTIVPSSYAQVYDASGNLKVNLAVGSVTTSQNLTQVGGAAIALGQTTMANSLPVAIASNQTDVPANVTKVGGAALALGQTTMAASVPVTLASNSSAVPDNLAQVGGAAIALGRTTAANSLPVTLDSNSVGSAANLATTSGNNALLQTMPGNWSVIHEAAANTKATITKAAGAAGVRHVVNCISGTVISGGNLIQVWLYVRDGATGAGTILWVGALTTPATNGTTDKISLCGLNIVGSAATAMTIEFGGAPGAANYETVSMSGYDAS